MSVLLPPAPCQTPISSTVMLMGYYLLQDVNDNTPVFLQQSYEFFVFESSDGMRRVVRLWDKQRVGSDRRTLRVCLTCRVLRGGSHGHGC